MELGICTSAELSPEPGNRFAIGVGEITVLSSDDPARVVHDFGTLDRLSGGPAASRA